MQPLLTAMRSVEKVVLQIKYKKCGTSQRQFEIFMRQNPISGRNTYKY